MTLGRNSPTLETLFRRGRHGCTLHSQPLASNRGAEGWAFAEGRGGLVRPRWAAELLGWGEEKGKPSREAREGRGGQTGDRLWRRAQNQRQGHPTLRSALHLVQCSVAAILKFPISEGDPAFSFCPGSCKIRSYPGARGRAQCRGGPSAASADSQRGVRTTSVPQWTVTPLRRQGHVQVFLEAPRAGSGLRWGGWGPCLRHKN